MKNPCSRRLFFVQNGHYSRCSFWVVDEYLLIADAVLKVVILPRCRSLIRVSVAQQPRKRGTLTARDCKSF